MTIKRLVNIAIVISTLSLCCVFAMYFYLRQETTNRHKDFNLYSLVPQDAIAVVETNKMLQLVEDINQLECSKDGYFLNFSELFNHLKIYLNSFSDNAPHGLSRQMNKMILSFHEPDTPENQVLYCALGDEDSNYITEFINQYQSPKNPFEEYKYRGEHICMIPIENQKKLFVCFTDDFLIITLKKTLLHNVIDSWKEKNTLMNDSSFYKLYALKQSVSSTTAYVKMRNVELGRDDIKISNTPLGEWAEFNFLFDNDAIYCSGMNCQPDSLSTFMNLISKQQPLNAFPGKHLPQTTFFFNTWSLTDFHSFFNFTSQYTNNQKLADKWVAYLEKYIKESVLSCLFRVSDDNKQIPCAVLHLPLKNKTEAEKELKTLLLNEQVKRKSSNTQRYSVYTPITSAAKKLNIYALPNNALHAQLTGVNHINSDSYAAFYNDAMLIASNKQSLQAYVDAIEKDKTMEDGLLYQRMVGSLATTYHLIMMVDMERIVERSESYVRYIPNFFYRHVDFFRHFTFVIQIVNLDGVAHPNVVLLYN